MAEFPAHLVAQWHPDNPKPISAYTHGSHYKAHWLCSESKCEHKHEWQATIKSRAGQGSSCPFCCSGGSAKQFCPCRLCPDCALWNTGGSLCDYCNPESKMRQKTKEMAVVKRLRKHIYRDFFHNKSVGSDCTKDDRSNSNGHLFPDIRYDCLTYQLIVEVDEFKHRGADYACDERRMYDIIAKLGQPCMFIRYNPDNKDSESLIELACFVEEHLEKSDIEFSDAGLCTEYLFY